MGRGKGSVVARGESLQIDFRYNGERIRATLPLSPKKKAHIQTAEQLLATIQYEIAIGTFNLYKHFPNHPKAKKYKLASDIYIKVELEKWLDYKFNQIARSTWNDYKSAIYFHLIPTFGGFTLTELKTSHIREWLTNIDISNQRKNNVLIPLRQIYADAYQDGLISSNPLHNIPHLPRKTPEPDPFSRDEMDLILNASPEGHIRNIFQFGFWTGLRTSELIALRWVDVKLTEKSAYIRNVRTRSEEKDRPKNESSIRKIELLPPAIHALKNQRELTRECSQIFLNPNTGEPWKHDGPLRKTAWKKAVKASGVRYRTCYTMRHTFASMMLSAGQSPVWVQSQMGHSNCGQTFRSYTRWVNNGNEANTDKIAYLWAHKGHEAK